jgi:hypothetical protein
MGPTWAMRPYPFRPRDQPVRPASAQGSGVANGNSGGFAQGLRLAPSPVVPTPGLGLEATTAAGAPAADSKSPVLAGVLSFLIPGVGSFYAGNTNHGLVHLGIDLGAIVVMSAGFSGNNQGAADVGYFAYIGNWIWSIFTAVGDANAYNGSPSGKAVGELDLQPVIGGQGPGAVQRGVRTATPLPLFQIQF